MSGYHPASPHQREQHTRAGATGASAQLQRPLTFTRSALVQDLRHWVAGLRPDEQLANIGVERNRYAFEEANSGVLLAALQGADVGPTNTRIGRQRLL